MRFNLWDIFIRIFLTSFYWTIIIGVRGIPLFLAGFVIWGIWIAVQSVKGLIIISAIIIFLVFSYKAQRNGPAPRYTYLRAINSSDGSIWGYEDDDLPSENDSKKA